MCIHAVKHLFWFPSTCPFLLRKHFRLRGGGGCGDGGWVTWLLLLLLGEGAWKGAGPSLTISSPCLLSLTPCVRMSIYPYVLLRLSLSVFLLYVSLSLSPSISLSPSPSLSLVLFAFFALQNKKRWSSSRSHEPCLSMNY